MKPSAKIFGIIVILILLIAAIFSYNGCPGCEDVVINSPKIQVTLPEPDTVVTSPLVVKGKARGNWFFEASFPIKLFDSKGNEIALAIAQAGADWMTTDFVPFEATLIFTSPTTPIGTLVLEKDNPSGLSENNEKMYVPVKFQ